ncbi:LysR family transcriptional regulator [Pseudomonas sp. FSL R10-1350]|jgi:DNA-binding transcriptional LysR family regulator|uniref:LysR family transcriptional regulator n=1 Tax=Pseudomonas TaxID=286 RepID=UPI000F4BA4E8|nr:MULTISPECIES: LysR family transcriptional regulator [Pseudomonas]MCU1757675.1 LysR family transcriptional regulator [Pseudomonas helleri]MQT29127.1 LysR family transcriptional regulator [Pseudomonas helleri]MQT40128.1 LysR family transcriptional regulator [Pseudomonas sp. FSL R10-0765]MQT51208.1 LysR family transcriptional regulator [Pseudomonas sp. FSL R10-2398]MQU02355.1 LysR family transcriptional regulator [Pseudomonas sp. FSL R10-2245]
MDRFNAMLVFTRIVELGGFAKAADSLQMPRASVTVLIKQLEAHVGVQLLHRTTRQVSPTLDGAAYYQRCVRLLADLEESEGLFRGSQPKGTLRVEMPAAVGRLVVFPALPEFTGRYPQIDLEIGLNDRPVDLIREGVDCVIRGGLTVDDSLVARPLVQMDQMTCASPDYLRAHGVPQSLDDLNGHRMIEYFSSASGKRYGLEFQLGDDVRLINLPKQVSVNSAEGYLAACVAGYGLVQTPRYHVAQQVREGSLQEVLSDCLPPRLALTALYPPHRQLSPRVRVFVDWLVDLCSRPDSGFKR